MGDEGEYWNDHKEYEQKVKARYEKKIAPMLSKIIQKSVSVGDHWRFNGVWDFWHTGTVRNIKTGEDITINELYKLSNSNQA